MRVSVSTALLVGVAAQLRAVREVAASGAEEARAVSQASMDPQVKRLAHAMERLCLAITGAVALQEVAADFSHSGGIREKLARALLRSRGDSG